MSSITVGVAVSLCVFEERAGLEMWWTCPNCEKGERERGREGEQVCCSSDQEEEGEI